MTENATPRSATAAADAVLRQKQLVLDEAEQRVLAARQALADVSNTVNRTRARSPETEEQQEGDAPPTKRRKRRDRKIGEGQQLSPDDEDTVIDAGKALALSKLLWIRGSWYTASDDSNYDPAKRFENDNTRIQGVRADIKSVLPKDFKDKMDRFAIRIAVCLYAIIIFLR